MGTIQAVKRQQLYPFLQEFAQLYSLELPPNEKGPCNNLLFIWKKISQYLFCIGYLCYYNLIPQFDFDYKNL
jgi:hypothetical protein